MTLEELKKHFGNLSCCMVDSQAYRAVNAAIAERDRLKELLKIEETTCGVQRVTIEKAKERIAELEAERDQLKELSDARAHHAIEMCNEVGELSATVERYREFVVSMQHDAENYLVPDKTECDVAWFISRILWHLDGPKSRALSPAPATGLKEHCERAAEEVAKMPEWKQTVLGGAPAAGVDKEGDA